MTRRRPKSSNNRWLILIQVLIMGGVLVFIIFFRDTIGDGASTAFDSVAGTEDIQVEKGEPQEAQGDEEEPAEEDAGDARD